MKFIGLAFVALMLFSCGDSLEIPQSQVTSTLLTFGAKNSENTVKIQTALGEITLKLYDKTPLHRANFIRLVKANYFDSGSEFYRIVPGICVQAGKTSRNQYLNYTIPAEFSNTLIHKQGALAMARYTENNPRKESSATEFFIITKGKAYSAEELLKYSPLQQQIYLKNGGETAYDGEYTVFGEVTNGLEVALKIALLQEFGTEKPSRKIRIKITL